MKDIEIYIESLGENHGPNQLFKADYLHDSYIKVTALNYILTSKNLNEQFFNTLVTELINKDQSLCTENIKFSTNSLVHRERIRIMQTLLAILPRLNETNYSSILARCEQVLLGENQPSIRALTEWVYIRILAFGIEKIDLNALWEKVDAFSFYKVSRVAY